MQGLLVILGLVVLILLLPAILPVVALLDARERRRRGRQAENFACVRCGQTLGREALELADAAWAARFAALQRAHPHAMLRVVRDVFALCPHCGQHYGYDERAHVFQVLPGRSSSPPDPTPLLPPS